MEQTVRTSYVEIYAAYYLPAQKPSGITEGIYSWSIHSRLILN